jgi:DNA-binding GntR family transcriptional regulator
METSSRSGVRHGGKREDGTALSAPESRLVAAPAMRGRRMSRVSGAAERVRVMILAGEIAPGEPIAEERLRPRLGVGRPTLREALRRLEGEGLLVASHSGAMSVVAIDDDVLREAVQTRAALEGLSAGLAARGVRDGAVAAGALETLAALAGAADSAARSAPAIAGAMADRNLHRAVDALGANRPAQRALAAIWDRLILAEVHGLAGPRRGRPGHASLLDAIAAGDEDEAAGAARRHVLGD